MPVWLIYPACAAVMLAPLFLAWLQGAPPRGLLDELASGAGLLAAAIILLEFPLSGRFRLISRKIGMDVTMRWHQRLGRIAVGLALMHPFLYQASRNPPLPWDVTRQFTISWTPETILPGLAAWCLLAVLVGLAISRSDPGRRYHRWRLGHGLSALVLSGLLVWHILAAGRYSADPLLIAFWLALGTVAVLALAKVYLVGPWLRARRPWHVARVRLVADRTWELVLAPEGHEGLRYEAGQFAWLHLGRHAFSVADNPFSIASSPSRGDELRFVIKELGDFTRSLSGIPIGARAYVDGPYGHLTLTGHIAPEIAMIAGGVGIAPMLGLIDELQSANDTRPVTLIYGNRVEEQIVDKERLEILQQTGDLRVIHVLSQPPMGWGGETGVIDRQVLSRNFPDAGQQDRLYILCGPPAMLNSVRSDLLAMGVPKRRILSEAFVYD
ncbi:ferric reductase-like transmembrane domain-containing protein [Lutimaribacter marinistellae]|uniref:Ferric reductase-like transmembrane domain-containing protein n=1 Tax=Lutimaribacter marinistellae TaxID=1820329 RepID=A0ABV7TEF7_9RHOB